MKCRHRKLMHYGWHTTDGYWYESPYLARFQADASCCLDCGAWLPLGPSNDEPEAVKVEMRAAELAAQRGFGSFSNCGAGCERCGYYSHKNDAVDSPHPRCNVRQFDSGHLAREIATHDERGAR